MVNPHFLIRNRGYWHITIKDSGYRASKDLEGFGNPWFFIPTARKLFL